MIDLTDVNIFDTRSVAVVPSFPNQLPDECASSLGTRSHWSVSYWSYASWKVL